MIVTIFGNTQKAEFMVPFCHSAMCRMSDHIYRCSPANLLVLYHLDLVYIELNLKRLRVSGPAESFHFYCSCLVSNIHVGGSCHNILFNIFFANSQLTP